MRSAGAATASARDPPIALRPTASEALGGVDGHMTAVCDAHGAVCSWRRCSRRVPEAGAFWGWLDGRARRSSVVRSGADRLITPTRGVFEEVGDMMILTGKTIVSAVRPPYPYGGEFVQQFLFALRLCWFPLLISTVAFGYGAPGLQAANFLVLFGALDRLGGFFVLASIREFAPFVTRDRAGRRRRHGDHRGPRRAQDPRGARRASGARRRSGQEPRRAALPRADARDRPVRHLRAAVRHLRRRPRDARLRPPLGPFWATFFTNASVTDLWGSVLKCTMFGAIIAIVCCYKGMTASGGAEGVGRAVNQAVVIAFLGVFAFNYVFTQTLLATHPQINVIR